MTNPTYSAEQAGWGSVVNIFPIHKEKQEIINNIALKGWIKQIKRTMEYKIVEVVTPQNYQEHVAKEMDRAPKYYKMLKEKYPDHIILCRRGDFYETYCEDAYDCSQILGITLSGKSYRMAGFPFHALNTYLPKLIRTGISVVICDYVE